MWSSASPTLFHWEEKSENYTHILFAFGFSIPVSFMHIHWYNIAGITGTLNVLRWLEFDEDSQPDIVTVDVYDCEHRNVYELF